MYGHSKTATYGENELFSYYMNMDQDSGFAEGEFLVMLQNDGVASVSLETGSIHSPTRTPISKYAPKPLEMINEEKKSKADVSAACVKPSSARILFAEEETEDEEEELFQSPHITHYDPKGNTLLHLEGDVVELNNIVSDFELSETESSYDQCDFEAEGLALDPQSKMSKQYTYRLYGDRPATRFKKEKDTSLFKHRSTVNLFELALGKEQEMPKALTKAAMLNRENAKYEMVAVGTKDDDGDNNHIIFTQIEDGRNIRQIVDKEGEQYSVVWTQQVRDSLNDIHWIDECNLLFTSRQHMGILNLDHAHNPHEILYLPALHTDEIREVALQDRRYFISGGYDGKVVLGDLNRLVNDIRANEKMSMTYCHPIAEGTAVGSVAWHPSEMLVASCTTDVGEFHIFDTRMNRSALVVDTAKHELYTHAHLENNMVLLGFGDGTMEVLDYRISRSVATFTDPNVSCIGDVTVDRKRRIAVTSGEPTMGLWHFETPTQWIHYALPRDVSVNKPLNGISKRTKQFYRDANLNLVPVKRESQATTMEETTTTGRPDVWSVEGQTNVALATHSSLMTVTDDGGHFSIYSYE